VTEEEKLPRLEWRDSYSVGVPAIDHEHRELIALLNAIIDALEAGGETEPILDVLGEVNARISAHFALEEQIMRERRYDQYAQHKTDHERLLDDIREIMDAFAEGSYVDRRDALAARLREWFVAHSKTMDARLHKHLRG
jgi:hemerythrin